MPTRWTRLHLLQERADLEAELARIEGAHDVAALEQGFVHVAKTYGERKGIGYNAWRAAGVTSVVLQRAGIGRTTTGRAGPASGASSDSGE